MTSSLLKEAVASETEGEKSPADSQLPFYAAFGWGLGTIGPLVLIYLTNSLALKYTIDFIGLSAAVAGSIIAGTRIFDALLDPFMGTISDGTKSRWGRRRPFLLIGGVMCAITPILLFAPPVALSGTAAVIYVTCALLFYAIAYTAFNVPYMAMPVEMTQNHHERTYLFTFRVYASSVAGLFGGALAPALIDYFGGGAFGFAMMSYIMGGLIFVVTLACFFLTANAPVSLHVMKDKQPKLAQMRLALGNKPFVTLLLAKVFIVSGTGIATAAMAFFVTTVLERPLSLLGGQALALTVGVIASQYFWLRVARNIGKRRAFLYAAPVYIILTLSWLLAGPTEPIWIFFARSVLCGFAAGGILLTSQAMLPDTLEHEYELTGVHHEGVLTGFYTTVERGSSAIGVAIAGLCLSLGGYVGSLEAAQQPETAIFAIYMCIAVLPAFILSGSIVAIGKYKLPG